MRKYAKGGKVKGVVESFRKPKSVTSKGMSFGVDTLRNDGIPGYSDYVDHFLSKDATDAQLDEIAQKFKKDPVRVRKYLEERRNYTQTFPPVQKKAFGGAIRQAIGKAYAAMPQSPLEAASEAVPGSTPAPVPRKRPQTRLKGLMGRAIPLHEMLAGVDSEMPAINTRLSRVKAGFAGGGKVSFAMGRLQSLAAKFEAALTRKDEEEIVRIGRQIDSVQPGASKKLLEMFSPDDATDMKLATFAKGGKVKNVKKAVRPSLAKTRLEFALDHNEGEDFIDDMRRMLAQAGIDPKRAKEFKYSNDVTVDKTSSDEFIEADVEGPADLIEKLKSTYSSPNED